MPSRKKSSRTSTTHVLAGWLVKGRDGDYSNALYLIDHRPSPEGYHPFRFQPIAKSVSELTGYGHKTVSVSYHITDMPASEDELTAMQIETLEGIAEMDYYHRYSELTGYLWTTETFKVGGHDMIQELSSYLGKWCHLIIKVN